MKYRKPVNERRKGAAGFTLAEVLAAMLLLALVIPTAIEGLHIASNAGMAAAGKTEAARVAEQVLNESLVMANWNQSNQGGTIVSDGREFHWSLHHEPWTEGGMQLLTAEVAFAAQNRSCLVRVSTLVNGL